MGPETDRLWGCVCRREEPTVKEAEGSEKSVHNVGWGVDRNRNSRCQFGGPLFGLGECLV